MKSLFIGLLFLSQLSFANDCNSDFKNGATDLNFGETTFNFAIDQYNNAVEESESDSPSIQLICDYLHSSGANFQVASERFQFCGASFLAAMSSCQGEDVIIASRYKNTCLKNKETAFANGHHLQNLYDQTCRK